MIYRLDVNVLVALFDPRHPFNAPTGAWTKEALGPEHSWATCAIAENGFLHVGSSQKFLGQREANFPRLMAAPMIACQHSNHQLWALDRSIQHVLPIGIDLSPKQITDVYLLAIAM